MSDQTFQMLLQSSYSGDENEIAQLHVEHLVEDNWQELDLNIYTAGFDVFMYAILTCQHMYFRKNAAEYGLTLDSGEGLLTVIASEHRDVGTLNVEFKGKYKKGEATKEIVDSISARMALCPVSINLKTIPNTHLSASFEAA